MKSIKSGSFRPNDAGFTLVETLVAAIVLSISVSTLFAAIRTGRDLQVVEKHRIQAEALINAVFEDPAYGYGNCSSLANGSTVTHPAIDDRYGNPLFGTMTITVQDSAVDSLAAKKITVSVVWPQVLPREDSISVEKFLVQLP